MIGLGVILVAVSAGFIYTNLSSSLSSGGNKKQ